MSHSKSHKQSSAPIIINVQKTQFGYQLINQKAANTTISLTKSMIAKTGNKSSKDSKDSVPKSMHKSAGPTTPSAAQKGSHTSKSKTSSKPSEAGLKAVAPAMSHSVVKERPAPVIQEVEIRRREIFPFTEFTGADGELEIPETNIPADLNIAAGEVNRLEKALESVAGQAANNLKSVGKTKEKLPLMIPSSAHWFKFDDIHPVEKEELSEFFVGKPSKTPETYKKYRNYIVDLYRQSPKIYLNSSKCRKSLGGDACAIMRIHHFLERWGIINFSVNPKRQQNLNMARPGRVIDKIFVFSKNEDKFDMFEFEPAQRQREDENDRIFHQIESLTKKYRPLCESCGMMCGLVWYQQKSMQQYQSLAVLPLPTEPNNPNKTPVAVASENSNPTTTTAYVIPTPKKSKELILCVKCFTDGNIPSILSHGDFAKISVISKLNSSVDNVQTTAWTVEDNVQLQELIENHADDWDEIQKVIPHRSQEEIILHYLELPLNNVTSLNIAEAHEDEDAVPDKAKEELDIISPSFNDYANPILQHVALFKSMLDKFKPHYKKAEAKGDHEKDAEIVDVKDEERTMEIEEHKRPMEEERKASRDLVINDAEFDFDKMEQERANNERGRHGHSDEHYYQDHRGGRPRRREDHRLIEATNTLVDLQMSKLQDKLDFFDEYEKILWHERRCQEVYQKVLIGERVALAHKRKEFMRREQPQLEQVYENRDSDPTAMLNFTSHSNMNVDDMIGGNDKGDDYTKDHFEN